MPVIEIISPVDIDLPTPVRVELGKLPQGVLMLRPEGGGPTIGAQAGPDGRVMTLISHLEANKPTRYNLIEVPAEAPDTSLKMAWDGIELHLPDGHFGTYRCDSTFPRPFLWPVHGPDQKRLTRAFPMEEVAGEELDHKHHRSLWTAYGEVNGADDWSEEYGHAVIRHQQFDSKSEGPVYAGFTAINIWYSNTEKPLLNEIRTVRLFNAGPDFRLLDYSVHLMAAYGPVEFGDTKEAGIISFRVASSMDGVRGGVIENAQGGKGEKACWGKRSDWCDYSGLVDGDTYGIAVLNHPANTNGAPRWHARDYGLMTSNPFANGSFTGGDLTPFKLGQGERADFRYRVVLHRGDAEAAQIADFYQSFTTPPVAKVVEE